MVTVLSLIGIPAWWQMASAYRARGKSLGTQVQHGLVDSRKGQESCGASDLPTGAQLGFVRTFAQSKVVRQRFDHGHWELL
jgi:hypothetical protein